MASVKGAICAICMHNFVCESDWALHAATAKPRSPRRSGHDGTLRPSREPRSRQPETDRAQSEKRKLSSPQSVVSVARIRLDSRKSVRAFKGIFCDDVSEFESYMPSHAVRSLWLR